MSQHSPPRWDRAAELDRIRATYAGYDRAGRDRLWDRSNRGYARLADGLLAGLIREIRRSLPREGGRLLDLGCGDGILFDQARSVGLNPEWVGVDLRPGVIATARHRYPEAAFVVASADEVPEEDASIDVVVAQLLFSSLPSPTLEAGVAGEITRLLRPGGWLVWLDLRYENPTNRAVHGMSERRIKGHFQGWRIDLHPVGLLPPVARRLGPATPLAYPVLAAVPALRSHLLGRMQAPRDQ